MNRMKYCRPTADVILFENDDVVTTSGGGKGCWVSTVGHYHNCDGFWNGPWYWCEHPTGCTPQPCRRNGINTFSDTETYGETETFGGTETFDDVTDSIVDGTTDEWSE